MRDVVGYLQRLGFSIPEFDDRSFTIALDDSSQALERRPTHNKAALLRIISGQRTFSFDSSQLQ